MDTTEIFGLRIARAAERIRRRREAPRAGAVFGEAMTQRLKLLAGLVAGRPLELRLVEGTGGWSGEALLQLRLGAAPHELPAPVPEARPWLDHALAFDAADSPAVAAFSDALFDTLPPPSPWGRPVALPSPVVLWGELLPKVAARDDRADTPDLPAHPVTRQLDPKRQLGSLPRKPDRGRGLPPLFHHFEKIETLQEHDGDATRADESGDPQAEEAALERMRPRHLIRTTEPSSACYRLDALLDGTALQVDGADEQARLHRYPEWHHRKRQYRADWCTLAETTAPAATEPDAAARARSVLARHRRRIETMRRRCEALLPSRSRQRRQRDGPELDLDAAVDRHATLAAGHTPDDRLYVTERRAAPDLAVYMLLDQSLSSDSWISGGAGGGVRILDVERETVLLLGEVLDGLLEQIGIASFSSHTRRRCSFVRIKGLDEPWPPARARIMAIEPAGYTRIGPAIRHAAARLARTRARRRLLLLVSDGRPTDYDQYEGRYGIKDVAQAVREAHAAGIVSFALAVETGAEARLTEMFGRGHFRVLHHPRLLPEAVSEILLRLRA